MPKAPSRNANTDLISLRNKALRDRLLDLYDRTRGELEITEILETALYDYLPTLEKLETVDLILFVRRRQIERIENMTPALSAASSKFDAPGEAKARQLLSESRERHEQRARSKRSRKSS